MLQFQTLSIVDFTGGLTDFGLGAAINQYTKMDNLILNDESKPVLRYGSQLLDSIYPQLGTGYNRVHTLINYNQDDALFAFGLTNCYRYVPLTGWVQLQGPTNLSIFPSLISTDRLSHAQWKGHLFIVGGPNVTPVKIFKDSGGLYQLRTAGLPSVPETDNFDSVSVLASAITLANEIRTDMLAHYADVVAHTTADTVATALIGAAATNEASLYTLITGLTNAYASHYKDTQTVSAYHYRDLNSITVTAVALAAYMILASNEVPDNLVTAVERLHDIKKCYNTHEGKDDVHNHSVGSHIVTTVNIDNVDKGPRISINLNTIYNYANLIQTRYIAHIGDGGTNTQPHQALDSTNLPIVPLATTQEILEQLIYELRWRYTRHNNDADSTGVLDFGAGSNSYHITQQSNPNVLAQPTNNLRSSAPYQDYFGGVRVGNISGYITTLNDFKTKFNAHMNNLTTHYTTNPTTSYVAHLISGGDLVLANYNYAFVYFYEYTAGTETFQDFGPPLFKEGSQVISIDNEGLTISQIPVLSNGTTTHYDTTTIKIKIYRTTDDGSVYFLTGEVTNGTTTYTDNVTDEELINREQLYTNGGVLDNESPPLCKFIHIVNNKGYYGNIQNTEALPNRIIESIESDIDSVPSQSFVDLPHDVTGISSTKGIPIGFTDNQTFRLEGGFDELGRGVLRAVAISEVVGNVAGYSPLQIDGGVVFFSNDQAYFTDGYNVTQTGNLWTNTFSNLVRTESIRDLIQSTYDSLNRKAYFITSTTGTENDSWQTLDCNQPLKPNSVWSSASNGASFNPTAICVYNNQIIRGDVNGYVFKHDSTYFNDPLIDTGVTPSAWAVKAIYYDYRSVWFDFNNLSERKQVIQMSAKFRDVSNLSVQIVSDNEEGKTVANLAIIRSRNHLVWGDPTIVWGTSSYVWNIRGLIDEKRKFPSGSLRCEYKQVRFNPAFVINYNSDSYGSATLVQSTRILTLVNAATLDWPLDIVGMSLCLDNDSYVTQYTITSKTSDTITVSDPTSVLPSNGTYKWIIKGYTKYEYFYLIGYHLKYAFVGETQSDADELTGVNT